MISPSERSKQWRKDNPEKIKAYNEKNKESVNKKAKEYYSENKEELRRKQNDFNKKNPKTKAVYNKKYRDNNKEYHKEYNDNYTKTHPHILKEAHNRVNFGGLREKALERDNFTCQRCGMTQKEHLDKWNCSLIVHHKDGVGRDTKKPNNTMDNLQTVCKVCHGKLHGRPINDLLVEVSA